MSKVNQSPSSIASTIERTSSNDAGVAGQFASTSLVARACSPSRRISAKPPLIAQLSGAGTLESVEQSVVGGLLAQPLQRETRPLCLESKPMLERGPERRCRRVAIPGSHGPPTPRPARR